MLLMEAEPANITAKESQSERADGLRRVLGAGGRPPFTEGDATGAHPGPYNTLKGNHRARPACLFLPLGLGQIVVAACGRVNRRALAGDNVDGLVNTHALRSIRAHAAFIFKDRVATAVCAYLPFVSPALIRSHSAFGIGFRGRDGSIFRRLE